MKRFKSIISGILVFALCFSLVFSANASEAAKKKIRLNKTKATVYVGKTVKLKVKGTKKKVKWSTKSKKIATVSKKGVVKGKKAGKTWITAKVSKKKLKCKITVRKKVVKQKKPSVKPTIPPIVTPVPTPVVTPAPTPAVTPTPTPGTEPGEPSLSDTFGGTIPTLEADSETGAPAAPVFSKKSGVYDEAFYLGMASSEGSTIYYTLDGSVPLSNKGAVKDEPAKLDAIACPGGVIEVKNRNAEENQLAVFDNLRWMYDPELEWDGIVYTPTISQVPKATVIRAMAVSADGKQSPVVTKTFFVGNNLTETYKNASVISVVTDVDNLLSSETGICRYGNWDNSGDAWERPAEVTYIEDDGTIPFETTMGLRVHGGYSRKWGQKSFRLYFREELGGLKNLKGYQLIPGAMNADGKPTTKYKNFILRNGGNDYKYTKLQDVWTQRLVNDRAFTIQNARPCVLFLNGEYWGLYNVTERYSDNYIETKFNVNKDEVIVVKCGELDEGMPEDMNYYYDMCNLANLDMSVAENYSKFTEMVDETSYIDYFATELYIANNDWPNNNVQLWRTRVADDTNEYADTKWRYMLYDTDFSMNLYDQDHGNSIDRARGLDSLFNALCENEGFRQKLSDTIMELADNNFKADTAIAELDKLAVIYRPLMMQYYDRWFGEELSDFDNNIQRIKDFTNGRKAQMQGYIKESFGIVK